jgi:hypothetical protein
MYANLTTSRSQSVDSGSARLADGDAAEVAPLAPLLDRRSIGIAAAVAART